MRLYLRDLFFPPRCAGCGTLLPPFDLSCPFLCPACRVSWASACATAGQEAGLVYLVPYQPGRPNGIPQRVIYGLKHRGDSRMFDALANQLAGAVAERLDTLGVNPGEVVVAYPPRRQQAIRKDGYDQARELAVRLSARLGTVCLSTIKRRRRAEGEQKMLDAKGRERNAEVSYCLRKTAVSALKGKFVVLIDDLCTTGATLRHCADLLLSAGAEDVLWATVARTAAAPDHEFSH